MKCIYTKPELENLSQGERIAFARQMRNMTQDEVSEKLGFTGECKRRSMARYERGDRVPKGERLQEIANILNINVKCIKEYNFNDDEDMIYMLLWMEEMFEKSDLSNIALYLEMPENSSYSNIMTALICSDDKTIKKCRDMISAKSKENFDELYNIIKSVYNTKENKKNEILQFS